ncbi:HAD family hydrolase [Paenibacillus arenilitoris]|uniref:HAD family phosphatase n=1 Tax=Paenibacillus arenilitoris TaxID=2772299 RepID=A0A927CQ46_9BACL|nr:HAD family hydrolase [Paenibacillus arenilitoris]MBD2871674.1 HAD family phosphatase [Paenibacillus arenilitoris]
MIRLFASDIDGTLMNRRKEIEARDVEAVRQAIDGGMTVCLASGRMYDEIKLVMERLGRPCYAICQNGASVYSDAGELLHAYRFDRALASSLFDFVHAPGLVPVVCAADGNFVLDMNEPAERVGRRFLTPPIEDGGLRDSVCDGKFRATKFSVYGEVGRLERLLRDLADAYGESVTASFSDPDGVDVMPAGVHKGAALRSLMSRLGIGSGETACIGDSYNDLAMFRATPHSFAMEDADEAVRRVAAHAVVGVAEALRRAVAWG